MATFSGGYDYEFVDAPPKSLECSICLLTLRDPHVVSCCGNHFCYSCINRISNNNNPCPLCNEPGFTTLLHKGVAREVNALKIYCPNKPQGCDWQGELGQVEKHLNPEEKSREKGCGFVMVDCKYKCGSQFQRKTIARHEMEECPQRPMEVQMAQLMKKFDLLTTESQAAIQAIKQESQAAIQAHKQESQAEMQAIKQECQAEIQAIKQESQAEIDAIKTEIKAKVETVQQENKVLREKGEAIEAEVLALKAENTKLKRQLEIHSPPAPVPPFYFPVYNYSTLRELNNRILSPPFYSHPGGYKMELEVFPNGFGSGHKTHLSVFVRILRGEYDDNLRWPFKGMVTIQMYDCKQEKYTRSFCLEFDSELEKCMKKPVETRGNYSYGYLKFCLNDEVTKMYRDKDDFIRLRVTDVHVTL